MATTATIPANTLPFRTFSWPSFSAPLLLFEEVLPVLPCEKPVAADPEDVVMEDPEFPPELPCDDDEPWLSTLAGLPPPLRPGTVSAVLVAAAEAVPEGFPASMSSPVPWKEASTVAFLPSITVSLRPV